MHPRLTVLSRVFEQPQSIEHVLREFEEAGAQRIGLYAREVDDAADAVLRSDLVVTHLGHGPIGAPAGSNADPVVHSIELAHAVGAACVYGPAYGDPVGEWDEAAIRFADTVGRATRRADELGIRLLIEPTISLFADISMLHTLEDTLDLAERANVGVCIDVQHCWRERRLREMIRRSADRLGLVQLSDWVPGNRHHFRAVPGDGAIPLERIVGWILDTGYDGYFDLELSTEPGVPPSETISRAIERGDSLMERVGA